MAQLRAVMALSLAVSLAGAAGSCDGSGSHPDGLAPQFTRQGCTNVERLRVADAWAITRGSPSTVIAILDTGLDPSRQNPNDTVAGTDLVVAGGAVVDAHGHGSAMFAAIKGPAAGQAGDPGVCPACKVMPIRIVADASTDTFDVVDGHLAAGLRFARDNGAQIALVGVVGNAYPPATAAAIADVIASGVTVIAPAGANGRAVAGYPARLPGVISVSGTTSRQDFPLTRSNGFAGVDVWAPSDSVSWEGIGSLNGTSLASAYVAGVVGLMKSEAPSLSAAAVGSLLQASSVPLEPGEPMQMLGGGRVDARAAVDAAHANPGAVVAIGYAEPYPTQALPSQAGRVHARIQNRGTVPVERAGLTVAIDPAGATASAGSGMLAPGESAWIDVPFTATSLLGRAPLEAHVTAANTAVDVSHSSHDVLSFEHGDPQEQMDRLLDPAFGACPGPLPSMALATSARRVAAVTYGHTKNVRLFDFDETTPPGANPKTRTFRAILVNAGNTAFTAGAVATLDGQPLGKLDDAIWAPGAERDLDLAIDVASAPQEDDWAVAIAPSVVDDDPGDDRLSVKVASGLLPRFDLAYADFAGTDIEFDAPYRVNVPGDGSRGPDDDYIPFLAYVPEYRGASDDEAVFFALYVRPDHPSATTAAGARPIEAPWDSAHGARLLYVDWRNGSNTWSSPNERAFCTACLHGGLYGEQSAYGCLEPCHDVAPASGTVSLESNRWRPVILDENAHDTNELRGGKFFDQTDPLRARDRWGNLPKPPNAASLFDAQHPGWHRVIRIPRAVAFGALGLPETTPRALFFHAVMGIAKKAFAAPFKSAPLADPLSYANASENQNTTFLGYNVWSNAQQIDLWSRVLRVAFDKLPFFKDRPNDRYYDAHTHTMAEGVINATDPDALLRYLDGTVTLDVAAAVPMKEWGGPLVMLTESAFAQGFTPYSDLGPRQSNRIITTDHNQFYSDTSRLGIPPSWIPPTGPLAAAATPGGAVSHTGEHGLMRGIFGRGAGEELTLAGGLAPIPRIKLPGTDPLRLVPQTGRHALLYDAAHLDGPWHGDERVNPWNVTNVLYVMKQQGEGDASKPAPTIFPAHPFSYVPVGGSPDLSSPQWRMWDLEQLMGMWPNNSKKAYAQRPTNREALVALAPGYQIWNQKLQSLNYDAFGNSVIRPIEIPGPISVSVRNPLLPEPIGDYQRLDAWMFLLSPGSFTTSYDDGASEALASVDLTKLNPTGQRGWRAQVVKDLALYSYLLRAGLTGYRLTDDPTGGDRGARVYMRKVFGVGGNDAHGDFNFERINLTTALDCSPVTSFRSLVNLVATANGVADSAWGRVRTYALAEGPDMDSSKALDAMLHGNAVVTDGPLVRLEVNANPYLNQAALNAALPDPAHPPDKPPIFSFDHDDIASHFDSDGLMGGTGPMGGTGTVLVVGLDGRVRIDDKNGGAETGDLWNTHCLGCELVDPRLRYTVVNPTTLYDPFASSGHEAPLTDIVAVLVHPNRSGPYVEVMGDYPPIAKAAGRGAVFVDNYVTPSDKPYVQSLATDVIKGVLPGAGDDGQRTLPRFGQRAAVFLVAQRDPSIAGTRWGGGTIAVTNPTWLASARLEELLINATYQPSSKIDITDARATLLFPISMMKPAKVYIQLVQGDRGMGPLIPASAIEERTMTENGKTIGADGIEGREFTFTWSRLPFTLSPADGHHGVVVYVVKPHDILDNELNSIAFARDYPSGRAVYPLPAPDDNVACEFVAGKCPPCKGNAGVPWCVKNAPPEAKCTNAKETFCEYGNKLYPQLNTAVCVDTLTDATNCGACGHTCAVDEECCGGKCSAVVDPNSCGGCGNVCVQGEQCCLDPKSKRHLCTSLATSTNCGACGLACGTGSSCSSSLDDNKKWAGAVCK